MTSLTLKAGQLAARVANRTMAISLLAEQSPAGDAWPTGTGEINHGSR